MLLQLLCFSDRSQIHNGIKILIFLLSYLSLLCFCLEEEGDGKSRRDEREGETGRKENEYESMKTRFGSKESENNCSYCKEWILLHNKKIQRKDNYRIN